MSASQARFLGLTARKNNVEFEGQQINQQRTSLSNQSANYYNDMLGMSVPVPPSVDNYTKTVYTFEDGALSNTITALIPKNNGSGTYSVSYLREFVDDFAVVSAASSVVTRVSDGSSGYTYNIGANQLRALGVVSTTSTVGNQITLNGKTYSVQQDETGYYINEATKVKSVQQCSDAEIANLEYYVYDASADAITQVFKDTDGSFYTLNSDGSKVPTTYTEDDLILALYNEGETDPEYAVSLVTKEDDKYMKEVYTDSTQKRYLTTAEVSSITTYSSVENDDYLKELTQEELDELKKEEAAYLKLLQDEYGTDTQWLVRYVKDASTGDWQPYFYNLAHLNSANTSYADNGNSQSAINCYTIGSKKCAEEVKNREGVKIEQDSTGRYINISFPQYDDNGNPIAESQMTTYALTTNTITDQDAYDDAMNQYEFEKYQYDQTINDINAKIEIIQAEDKTLELRLKQLDTEQKAISQELDSVSNVIKKNIESSFKTFG